MAIVVNAEAAIQPELPREYIDTAYQSPTGNVIAVNAGDDLQQVLNIVQLGDTIVLQAGATFTGTFALPNKTSGSGWIYIRSSAYANLPAPGNRVSPACAANMPKIVSGWGAPTVYLAAGAHHYRFTGIEFAPSTSQYIYNVIQIGDAESSTAALPHDITIDRCYIHGDPVTGSRRGVMMNWARVAVIDSYVSDFKEDGVDSQALMCWSSPGPIKIVNNYLEAGSENVLFGGADPSVTNMVPSDIEIRGNHLFKPQSWTNLTWCVKNLLEFKNAQRALVEGNVLENVWMQCQSGFGVVITPRNQDDTAPWSRTRDITIRYNILRNFASGFNILGQDEIHPTQQTQRILIQNNVILVTGYGGYGGQVYQIVSGSETEVHGVDDLAIDHNTTFNTADVPWPQFGTALGTPRNDRFEFKNNIVSRGNIGFFGAVIGEGNACLQTYFTNWVFTTNAIIGLDMSAYYPAGNYFPATANDVGFVDYPGGNYRLANSSPYRNAGTDGKDLGADIAAVDGATAWATTGQGDAIPPTVSITAPSTGATVSNTVIVTAMAADNVGVVGVQFRLNGQVLGLELASAPYSVSWDSTASTNLSDALQAIARDAAGNTNTSAVVTVTAGDTYGLPNWWKAQWFGSPTVTDSCALADPDHDRMNNLAEYIASTIPTNASSKLCIKYLSASLSGLSLFFDSAAGRYYNAQYADHLPSMNWESLMTDAPGTGGELQVTDTNKPARRFYRIQVNMPKPERCS